ncbi:MAG: zinc-ribbon domain-containing protein [Deltaproteobacteria bacterium]
MKVQCGQCPAKYAVADERVQDKKVRIRCRRCNAAIVVDGKVTPPLVTSTPARRSAGPSSIPAPESAPPASPEPESRPSPRPVAHTIMGGLEAPVTRQLVADHVAQRGWSPLPEPEPEDAHGADPEWFPLRPGMPEADRGFTEPPARGDVDRWRVALTQQDLRWMTTQEITQAFRDGAVKSETFVFRAGMPTWVTLLEVTEIAQALADAGFISGPLQAPRVASVDEENGSRPSDPSSRRISSLPPPRKATRQRSSPGETESAAGPVGDAASDSDESLPFALSQRANGAKKSTDASAVDASAEPMAVLDASLRELAAREGAEREAAARESAAAAGPAAPATSAEKAAAPAVPSSVPSPLEPVPTASVAQPKRGGGLWIGLLVVLLLAAAAVFYFRFSLGLP